MTTLETNERYIETIGRRKTAIARVRIWSGQKQQSIVVNGKKFEDYFKIAELIQIAGESLEKAKSQSKMRVSALVRGGGIHGQAEALRHGIARALIVYDVELRKKLKKAGHLKRDPRAKERRKFGLKKARKAPQWSKR